MSSQKWKQFLEDTRLHWGWSEAEVRGVKSVNDLADALSGSAGLSHSRAEREVRNMIRDFEEKVRSAVAENTGGAL
jgi:hypothetical protein